MFAVLLLVAATFAALNLVAIAFMSDPSVPRLALNLVTLVGSVALLWGTRREWHR